MGWTQLYSGNLPGANSLTLNGVTRDTRSIEREGIYFQPTLASWDEMRVAHTNSQAGDSKALITSLEFVSLKVKSNERGQSSANFSSSMLNSLLSRNFEVSGHS